jgi:hypothetical protein
MSTERTDHDDDHVRLQGGDGTMKVFCQRCGASKMLTLPVPIDEANRVASAFIAAHKGCRES